MACAACERRRKLMKLWGEAVAEWTKNPTGPSMNAIYNAKVNQDIRDTDSTSPDA